MAILASSHIPASSAWSMITFFPAGYPSLSAQFAGSALTSVTWSSCEVFFCSHEKNIKNDAMNTDDNSLKFIIAIYLILKSFDYFLFVVLKKSFTSTKIQSASSLNL